MEPKIEAAALALHSGLNHAAFMAMLAFKYTRPGDLRTAIDYLRKLADEAEAALDEVNRDFEKEFEK